MFVVILIAVMLFGYSLWFMASTSRALSNQLEKNQARSIDPDIIEARLFRIEEAIDAMAVQIERLGDQQRALLAAPRETSGSVATEEPR